MKNWNDCPVIIEIPDNLLTKNENQKVFKEGEFRGKCSQPNCSSDATHAVWWNEQAKALPCCGLHTETAEKLGQSLSVKVEVRKLQVIVV